MAWIFDTFSMNKGHSVLGVVTGKPLSLGGSLGREEATARGSLYCTQALAGKLGDRQRWRAPRASPARRGSEGGGALGLA
jgi:glutamate dehydrogenase/leucine dehydrogenase